jgi:hypothetical protein
MREDTLYKELIVPRTAGIFEVQICMLNNSVTYTRISDYRRGSDWWIYLLTIHRL